MSGFCCHCSDVQAFWDPEVQVHTRFDVRFKFRKNRKWKGCSRQSIERASFHPWFFLSAVRWFNSKLQWFPLHFTILKRIHVDIEISLSWSGPSKRAAPFDQAPDWLKTGAGFLGSGGGPLCRCRKRLWPRQGKFWRSFGFGALNGKILQSLPENSEFAPENRLEYYPFWGQSPIFSGWKCWVFRELLLLDFPFFLWIILGFFEEILLTDMTFANAPGGRRSRHASSPRWRLGRSLNR